MINLKLSKSPPQNACLLGYYHGTQLDVEDNIGLKDISYLWNENRTGYGHKTRVISYDTGGAHDDLTSSDIVVGSISARYRDLVDPTPLFWRHQVGSNTALGGVKRYVYSPLTDSITVTTDATAFEALYDIRKSMRLVEMDGTTSNVKWDIHFSEITVNTLRRVSIGGKFGWDLYVYIAEKPTKDRPLFVEFTSIDGDGNIEYNHRELVNPNQYISSKGTFEVAGAGVLTDEYALEAYVDNTYRMLYSAPSGMGAAMAIALWSDEADWNWDCDGTDIEFDILTSNQFTVTLAGKTIREVVQEINAANIKVKATLLNDYHDASVLETAGPVAIAADGRLPIHLAESLVVLHNRDTRFFVEKPLNTDSTEEWRPRLRIGHSRYDLTSGLLSGSTLTYSVPDAEWIQTDPSGGSNPYRYREAAALAAPDMVSVRNTMIDMSTVIVEVNGNNAMHLVSDYDSVTGLIKFTQPLDGVDSLTVSYSHEPDGWYEIEALNLNPIQKHFEDCYRLYVGVYITPSKIVTTPSGADPLNMKPCVGWVAGSTIAELQIAVTGIQDPTSSFSIEAQLIGVFQVSSQQDNTDVKVIDIRSAGGGVADNIDRSIENNPEVEFYADLGYIDGKPYAGSGVVIVEGPASILGNSSAVAATPSPSDGGFVDTTGKQDTEDIRRRLRKHSNAGSHNIIDLK